MTTSTECTCPFLAVGLIVTEVRNWSPKCPVHGIDTEWYRSPEQVEFRQERADRSRALQKQAARKRKK